MTTTEQLQLESAEARKANKGNQVNFLSFISSDGTMKIHRFELHRKNPQFLAENEVTYPFVRGRFEKTCIGKDGNGYFVCSPRARSFSVANFQDIPDQAIASVR